MSTRQIFILIGGVLQIIGVGVTANDVSRTRQMFREHLVHRRQQQAEVEAKQNIVIMLILILWLWIRQQTGQLQVSLREWVGLIRIWFRSFLRGRKRNRDIQQGGSLRFQDTLDVTLILAPPFSIDRSVPFEAQIDQIEGQLRKITEGHRELVVSRVNHCDLRDS